MSGLVDESGAKLPSDDDLIDLGPVDAIQLIARPGLEVAAAAIVGSLVDALDEIRVTEPVSLAEAEAAPAMFAKLNHVLKIARAALGKPNT